MEEAKSIYFADMSQCMPQKAILSQQKEGSWLLVDYETEDGLKGVGAYAGPETKAPSIELPIGRKGWYAIYIGINYSRNEFGSSSLSTPWSMYGALRAKLSGDPNYSRFALESLYRHAIGVYPEKIKAESESWRSIYEVFWKNADLTDQEIVFSTPIFGPHEEDCVSNISYIRLVPLEQDEIARSTEDKPRPETKKLSTYFCSGQLTGHTAGTPMYHPTGEEWVREQLEPYRDNDFGLMIWEAVRGDICTYRTKIGDVGSEDGSWDPSWVDPLRVAVDYAHEIDLPIYGGLRMVGVNSPMVRGPIHRARFYWENRGWVAKDPDGNPISHLSLAYPEVRNHWIDLFREMVDYGVDGVHLTMARSRPFVFYEEPVVSTFMEKYGEDPRKLELNDLRWLQHRADYITGYLREIRAMLDEEGNSRGTRLGFSVSFLHDPSPIENAMDIRAWGQEGLVDCIIAHPVHVSKPEAIEKVSTLKKEIEGTKVKLFADLYPRTTPGEEWAMKAEELYKAGADGFAIWDAERRTPRASEWAVVRRLGHRENLERYAKEAPDYWRVRPIKMLGGIALKFSYTDG